MALHGETPFLLGLRVQYAAETTYMKIVHTVVMHHIITVFRVVALRNASGMLPYKYSARPLFTLYSTKMPIRVVV